MSKFLILFCLFILVQFRSFSQNCSPNPLYNDSIYGVWPDTITNFPHGSINSFYQTNIDFKVPSTVTPEIDPTGQFVGSTIQSYRFTGITNLPSFLNYSCSSSNCSYVGGSAGCASIFGQVDNNPNNYAVTLNFEATVLITLIPGLPPTPVTQNISFTGYELVFNQCGNNNPILDTIAVISCPPYVSSTNISYSQSGIYYETISSVNGCDSVLQTINLTVLNETSSSNTLTICQGDSINWNGNTYYTSGTYSSILTNSYGCDSTATLILNVNNNSSGTENITACESYTWNGNTYSVGGTYTSLLSNNLGCDSIATLNLIINNVPEASGITLSNDTTMSVIQQNGLTYQWVSCPQYSIILGAESYSYSTQVAGDYAVIIANSCGSDTSECVSINITSVFDLAETDLKFFPNPTNEFLYFQISENLIGQQFQLSDYSGRTIFSGYFNSVENKIDLRELSHGVYFVNFENQQKTIKVLKQ